MLRAIRFTQESLKIKIGWAFIRSILNVQIPSKSCSELNLICQLKPHIILLIHSHQLTILPARSQIYRRSGQRALQTGSETRDSVRHTSPHRSSGHRAAGGDRAGTAQSQSLRPYLPLGWGLCQLTALVWESQRCAPIDPVEEVVDRKIWAMHRLHNNKTGRFFLWTLTR